MIKLLKYQVSILTQPLWNFILYEYIIFALFWNFWGENYNLIVQLTKSVTISQTSKNG